MLIVSYGNSIAIEIFEAKVGVAVVTKSTKTSTIVVGSDDLTIYYIIVGDIRYDNVS